MADLTFDDLIPNSSGAQGAPAISFDDLIPKGATGAPAVVAPQGVAQAAPVTMSSQMPELDASGFPTGKMLPAEPMNTMSYGDQMGHVANSVGTSANRVASNLPFADRATAGLMAATGTGNYSDNLAPVRAYNEKQAKENPVGEGLATVAGSALLPVGALGNVARGVGLGAKAIRGATLGGAIGGTQTASAIPDYSNITGQDISNVAEGTGIGAGLGFGLPYVAAGVGAAVRGIGNKINGAVSGIADPAREALVKALMGDGPPAVQQRLQQLGPQAMPLDAGANLQGIAQGLANGEISPAKAAVVDALTNRNAGTYDRLGNALDTNLGPARVPQFENEAINQARSGQITGVHRDLPQIFANAPPVDTTNVLTTIGQGLTTARGPTARVLQAARGHLMETAPNGAMVPVQDAQTLQNAKEAIDTLIDRGDDSLGVPAGAVSKAQGAIGQVRGQLNQALRQQVPGYARVMDQSSALAQQADALAAGKNDVLASGQNAIHPDVYARDFNQLSPEAQQAQRMGIRGAVDQAVGTKANDLQAVRGVLQGDNGWNTQKLGTAFGQPAADAVSQAAEAEQTMRNNYGTIVNNSQTANRQAMIKALQQSAPAQQDIIPNMSRVTTLGAPLQAASWLGNKVINAFRSAPDYAARDIQLAHAVTQQGPEAQELIRQLMQSNTNRGQNAAIGDRTAALIRGLGAVGPNAALSISQQQGR